MHYFIWIPLTLFLNFLFCLIAVKVGHKSFWWNYLLISVVDFIPTWSLASYWSKNLIFDGFIYDFTLVASGVLFMTLLGQSQAFSLWNWLGVFFGN
jgi:hypothetical protein